MIPQQGPALVDLNLIPLVPVIAHRVYLQGLWNGPPVDMFTGEDPEVRFEDWLPSLQQAADWNSWSADEQLIQLAGYLRGRAW